MYKTELELKELLLSIYLCIDNEYLDKYVQLVIQNKNTVKESFKTDKHHIVPRYYYRYNGLNIDNSQQNTVILNYKDHVLAHYYLAMCSFSKKYQLANIYSIQFCCNKDNVFIKFLLERYLYNIRFMKYKYINNIR